MAKSVNVIGAGMAGSIMTRMLVKAGFEVNLFDSNEKCAASKVSENLIGVQWYKQDRTRVKLALDLLNSLFPVRYLENGKDSAHHIYKDDLLFSGWKDWKGGVSEYRTKAEPTTGGVVSKIGAFYPGLNVICTGVWTGEIVPFIKPKTIVGHGFRFKSNFSYSEFLRPYKPFRQVKLIKSNPGEWWYSNSLAVKLNNFNNKHEYFYRLLDQEFTLFLSRQAGDKADYEVGYRPYFPTNGPIEIDDGSWVITGGYKSGLVQYPIYCQQVLDQIKARL